MGVAKRVVKRAVRKVAKAVKQDSFAGYRKGPDTPIMGTPRPVKGPNLGVETRRRTTIPGKPV